jgi:putative transposase
MLIRDAVPEERGFVRAVGASDDHVHVLVELAATMRLCDLVQSMKGVSARRWNQQPPPDAPLLRWQDGYWARSVSPDGDAALLRYVLDQRAHHSASRAPEPWELHHARGRD